MRLLFALRAVFRDLVELCIGVGKRKASVGGLEQSLIDQVGVAAIRRRGMNVLGDTEAEVSFVVRRAGSIRT